MKKRLSYLFAFVLAAFGVLTLFLSASVIFDLFGIREKEGNYVLFVVWANFISSLLYIVAAYGFIKNTKMTFPLLGMSAIVLLSALIGLFVYIGAGGVYETKTIGAMGFRIIITLIFAALAYFMITKKVQNGN
ncbi:MAG: hypothetical protein P1P88_14405 [Bacteroidales bacterium]|nr:hypothetical protein [Bacteroidales bacterium]